MSETCANPSCSVSRCRDHGKLFCAEIEMSSTSEVHKRRVAYVWLCDCCAQQMKPESEIVGEIVRELIARSAGASAAVAPMVN
jgi:hypothetical protein